MIGKLLKKIVGSKNDRELKILQPIVENINSLEEGISKLSDDELKAKTVEFRQKLDNGATLNDILPESFAVVRETGKRVLNMRHFDVQLVGGLVLHEGKIAEMKTGEGKTLVATLPVYLNALSGKGVHLITVNDYLATRDSEWMGAIYKFLGLSVGIIKHELGDAERKEAYGCDVTYGTNNEFGFDYLRDNMKFSFDNYVQRKLNFSIVDEVDSILIDEARTPLIISGPSEQATDLYYTVNKISPKIKKEQDYQVDEKANTVTLTEEGVINIEKLLSVDNLYDPSSIEILHHVTQALKAHALFKKDVDYMVKDGEVIIVDEFTGRLMPGRRYSEGLHQALEAKEGVKIESENQTLATITFQNYFRMYDKLAGMTGTADTEAEEFHSIYKLDVMVIPTNKPLIRKSYPDVIYRTEREKFNAVIEDIREKNKNGQPCLVGTISIEKSEQISHALKNGGIKHYVLNAKHHEKEAEIISDAGQPGAVTIATNMAGRGTDIVLGEGVIEAGGLHIIGTERHESRRIDNQLRGRAGRQGDPGSSHFYLSLEDDLLRIFGSDRISGIMEKLGMEEGQPIEHSLITRAVENAQKKVEGHNFDIRKHLLEYDDVMNKQREVIYSQRLQVLKGKNLKENILSMTEDILVDLLDMHIKEGAQFVDWDFEGLKEAVLRQFSVSLSVNGTEELLIAESKRLATGEITKEIVQKEILKEIEEMYQRKEQEVGTETIRNLEKMIMLQIIDSMWKDHLLAMDHLKEGIGLRGYAQKDPLNEYKKEGFEMFAHMIHRIKGEVSSYLLKVQIHREEEVPPMPLQQAAPKQRMFEHRGEAPEAQGGHGVQATVKREHDKVGRNDPCHCGSGKKYKKCCGK